MVVMFIFGFWVDIFLKELGFGCRLLEIKVLLIVVEGSGFNICLLLLLVLEWLW